MEQSQGSTEVATTEVSPFLVAEQDMQVGQKLELLLMPDHPEGLNSIFLIHDDGLKRILNYSATSQINQFDSELRRNTSDKVDPGTQTRIGTASALSNDPAIPFFPERDVIVSYTSSDSPGEIFTAGYSPATRRVVRQKAVGDPRETRRQILDSHSGMITWVWHGKGEFAVRNAAPGELLGENRLRLPGLMMKPLGSEEIAGVPCAAFQISYQSTEASALMAEPKDWTVCIASDGLPLRHVEGGVTTEVTSIRYGRIDDEAFVVPDGFTRISMGDDLAIARP